MKAFTTLTSRMVPILHNDVDTDQIIPAEYLKVTDKSGLAEGLFQRWRFRADGQLDESFAINRPEFQGAEILLAGDNFGCGSSREHAPWALMGWGIRAVISTSFADIFRNNSLKNGLLPIAVDPDTHAQLCSICLHTTQATLEIDLAAQTLRLPDGRLVHFEIDGFSKTCLLQGIDQLGYLLKQEEKIQAYEREHAA